MLNRKKYFAVLLAFILVFTAIPISAEYNENLPVGLEKYDMRILHNGKYVKANLVPKILKDDTVLGPLRFILESAGYDVGWNKNGTVKVTKGEEVIIFDSKKPSHKFEKIKGTILVDINFFEQFKDLSAIYDNTAKTIIVKSNNLKDDEVFDYDLGSRKIDTSFGDELVYRLNGGITFPKKNNSPLVIVMHGSHHFDKSEFNRYDLGYSYLLRNLKEKGYAAISLNVGMNYSFEDGEPVGSERINSIFEETLKELKNANEGKENNFGIDLKNKLDFDNVVLVGHSRSGQEIYSLADKYKDDDRLTIKGLLAIAPSRHIEMDYSTVDIPTGIILPQLDGDVDALDGEWIFNNLINIEDRKSESQTVFLYGANHNAFNQAILNQDEGDSWFEGNKGKISKEMQRSFLKLYTGKFVKTVTENKSLHDNIKAKNEDFNSHKAMINTYVPGEKVFDINKGISEVSANNAEAKKEVYSQFATGGTTTGFFPSGDFDAYDLLNITWKERNGFVDFNIEDKDIKDKDKLVFSIAQDPSNKLNNNKNQQIKITLIDNTGKESSLITKKDEASLKYRKGEVIDELFYSTHTPLGFLEIPLDEFKDIDKNNLKTIRINLTETDSGSLMLRFIQFN